MIYEIYRRVLRRKRLFRTKCYLIWSSLIYGRRLSVGKNITFDRNVRIDLRSDGKASIGSSFSLGKNCELRAFNGGFLNIEDGCFFNNNCYLACGQSISIGKNTIFGPNCVIVDHNHDFRSSGGLADLVYKTGNIVIGENVWIGANVTILRNTTIGDNSVIGAGCVVGGQIPANTILVQKKNNSIKSYERERIR